MNADGTLSRFVYDASGRLIEERCSDGVVIRYDERDEPTVTSATAPAPSGAAAPAPPAPADPAPR